MKTNTDERSAAAKISQPKINVRNFRHPTYEISKGKYKRERNEIGKEKKMARDDEGISNKEEDWSVLR